MKIASRVITALMVATILSPAMAQDNYKLGPDSQPNPNVPHGEVTHFTFGNSHVFPGTTRDYWVYVPKQYTSSKPACVIVFQDGGGYQSATGGARVPVVFDNLIAKGEMPITIAIMVNPGVVPAANVNALPRYNRSFEYDSVSGEYARFLEEELLPEVGKKWNLTNDPNGRALAGGSSGGSCAFFAAWNRPDLFRRVYSMVGSFTSLRGGQTFPDLIRKMEPKPIRVFLQDGSNDQDIYAGSWPIANMDMAAALKYAKYDVKFEMGTGYHSGVHGAAILPDAMRWLWRDYPKPISATDSNGQPVLTILAKGETWREVSKNTYNAVSMATNSAGEVFFYDPAAKAFFKIDTRGVISTFKNRVPGVAGIAFGPDGKLYATQPGTKRILSYDVYGAEEVLEHDIRADIIAINRLGNVYVADSNGGLIWSLGGGNKKVLLDRDVTNLSGLQFTPDQTLLIAIKALPGNMAISYQVANDGTLRFKQPYFDLHVAYDSPVASAIGSVVDTNGWLYVTTNLGVQVLDQASRVNGIIENPTRSETRLLAWGGAKMDTLYTFSQGKIYARTTKAKGVQSHGVPMKPSSPRL